MDPADALLTLAELAVALVGFSGLVTALQMRRYWSADHAQRLWSMLRLAVSLLFFSLFPLIWLAADRSPWLVCGGLLAVMLIVQACISTYRFIERGRGVNVYFSALLVVGGWSSAVVVSLNTLGIGFERGFAGYLVGLCWLVLATTMFFTRLVYLGLVVKDERED